MQKVFIKLALCMVIASTLTACSNFKFPWAYTITIRQGNIIDKEMFAQLEEGLSKKQVRYILGTPLIEDTFNPNQWDYYFTIRKDEKDLYNYRLTVHFEEDKLTHWDGTLDKFKSETEGLEEKDLEKDRQEKTPQEKDLKAVKS